MKSEVHVVILRLPQEEMVEALKDQIPTGYSLVDSELVTGDAAYFSFQKDADEDPMVLQGNEEMITITEKEN